MNTRGAARLVTALSGKDPFVGKTQIKATDSSIIDEARPSGSLRLNLSDRCEGRSCFLNKCRYGSLHSLGDDSKSRIGNLLSNRLSNWLGDRSNDGGKAHGSSTHHLWILIKGELANVLAHIVEGIDVVGISLGRRRNRERDVVTTIVVALEASLLIVSLRSLGTRRVLRLPDRRVVLRKRYLQVAWLNHVYVKLHAMLGAVLSNIEE